MNFKNEKPDLFRMMGEYYKLTEEVYVSMDMREVLQKCDAFLNRWTVRLTDKNDIAMAEGLVQGVLEWKNILLKGGNQ
jgi:hypothetical protein